MSQTAAPASGPADLAAAWRRMSLEPDAPATSAPADGAIPDRAALQRAIARRAACGDPRPIFVAALAVDGFSRVRSVLGDELTAVLMAQVAERLRPAAAEVDLGRLTPDAFGIAFNAEDLHTAARHAETARRAMSGVHPLGEHRIDVRITGGLSLGGPYGALVREAELALEAARAKGARAAVYDAAAHTAAAHSLSLMPELRRAIAHGGLRLEHQPKFDLRRRVVAGVESLIRWTHPRFGPLSPELFVGMAEETGDIGALTEWVVDRAVAEQAALAAAGHRLTFAVNLSGRLVGDREAIDTLLSHAAEAQGPLTFEITETALIADFEAARANVARLSAAGHGVSIDDYGAGLSSLSYLKQIAADELKLDRSLLGDAARSQRDVLLLRSTIDLAHALGMRVVAEGVEDAGALALLAGMGCDVVQGWLVSRPMSFERLRQFLDHPAGAAAGAPARLRA